MAYFVKNYASILSRIQSAAAPEEPQTYDCYEWFSNLDKLIHYVNQDGRINMFYSNPYAYTKAQSDANITWTVKTDDFFP